MPTKPSTHLPSFASTLLDSCPPAGQGVHSWLFRTARALHPFFRDKSELVSALAEASSTCGREVPLREIQDAVRDSERCAGSSGAGKGSKWPAKNYEQIEAIVADGPGLADLWELSPVRIETNDPCPDAFIDALFPGNPLLCVGRTNAVFATRAREVWRGQLSEHQLIVPSAMSAVHGTTKDSRRSQHTLDNTGPRQFLVVECDFSEKDKEGNDTPDAPLIRQAGEVGMEVSDICAAVLVHLATKAPLALVVHSGGKSLHGWFPCVGQPEEQLRRFMHYAVSIGGDLHTWTRSQFVRLPDGRRDNGRRQAVYYFNPEFLKRR